MRPSRDLVNQQLTAISASVTVHLTQCALGRPMAMTNAERQRAWRIRRRETAGKQPRRRGERAAQIAAQDGVSARTVYRAVHFAEGVDTLGAAYPELAQMIRQGRLRIGNRLVKHRVAIMLAEILLDDPQGFAQEALPLFRDRWTGRAVFND
jgi:hypothetical protein